MKKVYNTATGADGVKIAVFRRGRAESIQILAAAHWLTLGWLILGEI